MQCRARRIVDSHSGDRGVPTVSTPEVLDRFRAALIARDIVPPEPTLADGRLHRYNAAGAHGRGDAAYLQHLDGLPAGGSPYLALKGVKAHGLRVLRELWSTPPAIPRACCTACSLSACVAPSASSRVQGLCLSELIDLPFLNV